MSFQKITAAMAVSVCLLVGASSSAMAQVSECLQGAIPGGVFSGIVIDIVGQDCTITGVQVLGDVTIKNAGTVIMMNSVVHGEIRSERAQAITLIANFVEGDIVMRNNRVARSLQNIVVGGGRIRMINTGAGLNQIAEAYFNRVDGDLTVNGNQSAEVIHNRIKEGNITCRNNGVGNLNLDAFGNSAVGGRVICARDPFPEN